MAITVLLIAVITGVILMKPIKRQRDFGFPETRRNKRWKGI
ncbi:MAG: PepSY domain-containing protein [Treponema sp.]|jgi:uncharacterized iron-regulated membrane protein|nr:PepSY domain-containing protein [Treponema sp.]